MEDKENIFKLSYEEIQLEAERMIGRQLTEDELHSVKKGIEWGLLTDIDTVIDTAIMEAIKT
ncbi:MAG: hypothetical protein ABI840_09615 [bacterium]